AVATPIQATNCIASGARTNSQEQRVSITTPAVTMVAAWMRAETGVGPAIASGSQTHRGICADLPMAPMNSRTQMAVTTLIPNTVSGPPLEEVNADRSWPVASNP